MRWAKNSPALAAALLIAAAALLLWQFFFRSHSAMSALSEKDLPPAMKVDPNAPPVPITGPIPIRPRFTPGQ
jgi:hypothetical protein